MASGLLTFRTKRGELRHLKPQSVAAAVAAGNCSSHAVCQAVKERLADERRCVAALVLHTGPTQPDCGSCGRCQGHRALPPIFLFPSKEQLLRDKALWGSAQQEEKTGTLEAVSPP